MLVRVRAQLGFEPEPESVHGLAVAVSKPEPGGLGMGAELQLRVPVNTSNLEATVCTTLATQLAPASTPKVLMQPKLTVAALVVDCQG